MDSEFSVKLIYLLLISKDITKLENLQKQQYVIINLNSPCGNLISPEHVVDDGIEMAQCLAYAELCADDVNYYMLLNVVNDFGYEHYVTPNFKSDSGDIKKLIEQWLITNTTACNIDVVLKPLGIVGTNQDIIAFAVVIE